MNPSEVSFFENIGSRHPHSQVKLANGLTTMEEKVRLKKFKRQRTAFRPEIQPRDLEILKTLADYRFLNTVHIMALHPGGQRNLQRRLQKLYHAGYIDRPPRQLSYNKPLGHMVYGLGNKGADLLAESDPDFERKKIDWTTKNRGAGNWYINHALMISNFRTVLTLALKNHKEANLFRWWQGQKLKDYVNVDGKKIAIMPDALFTLEDAHNAMDFFLEADRSTMDTKRILYKMKRYWEWYLQWDKKDGKRYNEKLDVGPFRVLILCKTEERKESLRRKAKEVDEQGTGLRMFYFVSENEISLSDPERILQSIWQTPNDEYHALFE